MCKYYVPCKYCGTLVLVDQPDNSQIAIGDVECSRCHAKMKSKSLETNWKLQPYQWMRDERLKDLLTIDNMNTLKVTT